ncbi:MAG TPA: hypothetical protein ENH96_05820 [Chlamydiae bacterium]|nr:hypothetical protein [Chlamydiota bacterium]
MLENLIMMEEGKTLEFKENTQSLNKIVQTIIAFANTAGGTIIIGIKDKTKKIVGIHKPLRDEEKISSAVADSIAPLFLPNIEIHNIRNKELLVIKVPHAVGPFYLKKYGERDGTYIRLGSTNRKADIDTLKTLKRLSENITFDELPLIKAKKNDIDWALLKQIFKRKRKKIDMNKAENLGIIKEHMGKKYPSNGGILLFGKNRMKYFPDINIRCVRFSGNDRDKVLDHYDIDIALPLAIEEAINFVEKVSFKFSKFGKIYREDILQFPSVAIRESIINAVVHTDYSIKGTSIQIAIFDNRIEITNPGGLPFGLTLERAITGVSKIRNRVLARVFRELSIIEQWGSGMRRIIKTYQDLNIVPPIFEEIDTFFRIILFSIKNKKRTLEKWEIKLLDFLKKHNEITTIQAAELWKISDRAARTKLKKMIESKLIQRIGTSIKDPKAIFKLLIDDRI